MRLFLRVICWVTGHKWRVLIQDSRYEKVTQRWDYYRDTVCDRCGKKVNMRVGGWE